MDYTKKNGVLVPKQRLFAPMLATFGGGSARGFNPGGAAAPPIEILSGSASDDGSKWTLSGTGSFVIHDQTRITKFVLWGGSGVKGSYGANYHYGGQLEMTQAQFVSNTMMSGTVYWGIEGGGTAAGGRNGGNAAWIGYTKGNSHTNNDIWVCASGGGGAGSSNYGAPSDAATSGAGYSASNLFTSPIRPGNPPGMNAAYSGTSTNPGSSTYSTTSSGWLVGASMNYNWGGGAGGAGCYGGGAGPDTCGSDGGGGGAGCSLMNSSYFSGYTVGAGNSSTSGKIEIHYA